MPYDPSQGCQVSFREATGVGRDSCSLGPPASSPFATSRVQPLTTSLQLKATILASDVANAGRQDQLEKLAGGMAALRQELAAKQVEIDALRAQKGELESTVGAIEDSAGWQWLNRWRRLRNRLAPEGTRRRRLYDSVVNRLRRSS